MLRPPEADSTGKIEVNDESLPPRSQRLLDSLCKGLANVLRHENGREALDTVVIFRGTKLAHPPDDWRQLLNHIIAIEH